MSHQYHLKIWRQKNSQSEGKFENYSIDNIHSDMTLLEMLDVLNQQLAIKGEDPVSFDHDCREGICGSCSLVINGNPHGPDSGTTSCQIFMRKFPNGSQLVIEPFRAKAFPLIKDLVVNRSAFDRVIASGGYVSVDTGSSVDANATPISKIAAEMAMDSAACIGCGACVAACRNGSAMLFVGAKVSHLALLPQGDPERSRRVQNMMTQMDEEGFGSCTNMGSCAGACPKDISLDNIARLNQEYMRSLLKG
jgi:succinate dehydrogenase / fumarate reductase iron-sulfur subunit